MEAQSDNFRGLERELLPSEVWGGGGLHVGGCAPFLVASRPLNSPLETWCAFQLQNQQKPKVSMRSLRVKLAPELWVDRSREKGCYSLSH